MRRMYIACRMAHCTVLVNIQSRIAMGTGERLWETVVFHWASSDSNLFKWINHWVSHTPLPPPHTSTLKGWELRETYFWELAGMMEGWLESFNQETLLWMLLLLLMLSAWKLIFIRFTINHPSIPFLYPLNPTQGCRGAGAYPGCYSARDGVHPGQVISYHKPHSVNI